MAGSTPPPGELEDALAKKAAARQGLPRQPAGESLQAIDADGSAWFDRAQAFRSREPPEGRPARLHNSGNVVQGPLPACGVAPGPDLRARDREAGEARSEGCSPLSPGSAPERDGTPQQLRTAPNPRKKCPCAAPASYAAAPQVPCRPEYRRSSEEHRTTSDPRCLWSIPTLPAGQSRNPGF